MARSAIFAGVVIQTVLKCGVSHIKSPVSIPVPASIANYFSPVNKTAEIVKFFNRSAYIE